ncbi:MAG: thiamine phosphate synthase [Phycisphaerales bacterium]
MNPLLRILDANANRAREALRVLEDCARFALDHEPLARRAKELRHDLTAALAPFPRLDLLAARDTNADVGTSISTPGELARAGLPAIAAAAASRLTEALRSIEESAKALGTSAPVFESLRYRAYSLDRDLGLALASRAAPQWRLCVLLTQSLCTHHHWLDTASLAIRGGADCLQLREKSLDDADLLDRARRLVDLARAAPHPVSVIINDRPDIALLARADGVHLGQTDLPIADARSLVGARLLIGASTTNLDQARDALRQGADYLGLGPMFHTTTKHKNHISGPAYLRDALADPALAAIPHLAIGGISAVNAHLLTNCRGIAVSSAICSAPDPAAAARALLTALSPAP